MIILRNIATGIYNHFPIRAPEWIMAIPAAIMAVGLRIQPEMFDASPSFNVIAGWAEESTWMIAITVCYVMRITALTVNGTFHGFRYSPHIRVAASAACLILWAQFSIGIALSAWNGDGAISGVVAYVTLCVFECLNVTRAMADVGYQREMEKRRKGWHSHPSKTLPTAS